MYLDDILLHNLKAITHLSGKPDRHVSFNYLFLHHRIITNHGIVVKKEGKFGKYMLTAKALKEPGLYGLLFSKYAYGQIMSRNISIINKFLNENISSNMSDEEHMLFVFINKIGAFITYAMLEALQQDNYKFAIDIFDKTSTKNNAITTLSGKRRDDLSNAWVHGRYTARQNILGIM